METTGRPPLRLVALSDTLFRVDTPNADIRVRFRAEADGQVKRAAFYQSGRATALRPIAPWQPTAATLKAFVGKYYSPELETTYTAAVEDGRLVLRHRRHGDIPLTPQEAEGTFRGDGQFATVRFIRDARGLVTAMQVSNGRIRRLHFRKLTAGNEWDRAK